MTMIEEIGNKLYVTSQAHIVTTPEELPREMAFSMEKSLNKSFVWIAGRYVEAEQQNRNGHFWTVDDLHVGEASIKFTPLDINHDYTRPVGTFVETKMVNRPDERVEIQALSVLWGGNFPDLATRVREAHEAGTLWYSMECIAEAKQCLTCDETYAWASATLCDHLRASAVAPRRFINPTFLGGALVMPPHNPAWPDADITEVARMLTRDYANRATQTNTSFDPATWSRLMHQVTSAN